MNPIKAIKLWRAWGRIQKEIKTMNISNGLTAIQILAVVVSFLQNIADLSLLPPKWAALVVVALAFVQGLSGWLQRYYNPDGTTAKVAYERK